MRDECDHGQLRRSCEICEMRAELVELRQRIESAPVAEVSLDERGCSTISCDLEEGKRVRLVMEDEK